MKSFLSVWRSRNNMKSPDKISTWLEPTQVNVFYLSIVQPTEMSQLNLIKGRSWLYESEVCDDNWPCCPATCWLCVSQLSGYCNGLFISGFLRVRVTLINGNNFQGLGKGYKLPTRNTVSNWQCLMVSYF